jgi:methyl-accepting chemotaxis protein
LSDPTAATGVPNGAPRPRYKRKLSNYLLDKKLQLRYVLLVTILSGVIAGALGYLIYMQKRAASESIEKDLQALTQADASQEDFQEHVASGLQSEDRALVYKMAGVGVGLVVILSLYLLIMTHKVAGPLYKVSMYFDRMAVGRLGVVTPLRQGDMLQDFYTSFKEMHDALRARAVADASAMEKALETLRDSKNQADYRGEARAKLDEALDELDKHLTERKKQLA